MAIADWLRGKASELGETAKSAAAEAAKAADMPRTEAGEIDKAAVGGWLKGKIGEFAQSVKADFAREREAHKAEIETWKVIDQRFSPLVLPRTPQGMIKSYGDVPNFQEDFSSWKSILDEWPTPPKSEADRADREAIYWQRETRKNLARSEAGAIDILPKQTITDRWWLFEKWNFRRYYAATGIVHPSVFSDDFIFHWRSLQKYPKSRKHNGFIENVFSNVIPAHRDKWGNWYFFNVEQTFKKAVAPPTREFSKPSDEL